MRMYKHEHVPLLFVYMYADVQVYVNLCTYMYMLCVLVYDMYTYMSM